MEIEITSKDLKSIITNSEMLVIIDFWAPWCGPCEMLGPIIDKIANNNEDDNVIIKKVNVDVESEVAQQYSIRSIPTILVFKGGEVVERMVGLQSEKSIREVIDKFK
jgi:thioredoxin 1